MRFDCGVITWPQEGLLPGSHRDQKAHRDQKDRGHSPWPQQEHGLD